MIPGILTSLLFQGLLWIAKQTLNFGWYTGKQALKLPPVDLKSVLKSVLVTSLVAGLASPTHAGWFTRRPDPVTQAANQALERAAAIANQAASQQADQNIRVAEAISSLSLERTQLADLLAEYSKHATRESAWASALLTLGPVAIVVAILAIGGLALWLALNDRPLPDSELASVLIDEAAGVSPGPFSIGGPRKTPHTSLAGMLDVEHLAGIEADPSHLEEMPF